MSDKAYNVVNADSQKPLILTCEHASALIPDSIKILDWTLIVSTLT